MLRKITPEKDSVIKDVLLCDALYFHELENPKIIPLFGPNGIGKSTIIKSIIKAANGKKSEIIVDRDSSPITVYTYINSKDNMKVNQGRSYHQSFDPRFLIDKLNAQSVSEGQSIIYSIMDLFDLLGTDEKRSIEVQAGHENLLIIDEMDSGLSIDNLDLMMRKIKDIEKNRPDVQIIFSFNNPYVVTYFPEVINMYTGHPIILKTPDDMLQEIKSHEKEFRKKRYDEEDRPIVY